MTVVEPDEPWEASPETPLHELLAEVLALADIVVNNITPDELEERVRQFLATEPPATYSPPPPETRSAAPAADEAVVELSRREQAARREAESARAEATAARNLADLARRQSVAALQHAETADTEAAAARREADYARAEADRVLEAARRLARGFVPTAARQVVTEAEQMLRASRNFPGHGAVRLDRVSCTFQSDGERVEALRAVDLEIREGEFIAVVGKSGCGKSTLLRLIAGLLPPSAGAVLVGGAPVTEPRRDTAMLFQQPTLLPWRSVLDNVLLPVELFGWRRKAYRQRAKELLEMVGLGGFGEQMPDRLSSGMQQRVALCRALITEPKLLLMDEPFSALDELTRTELASELYLAHMRLGATTVFVTHSVEDALLLADRVVVLTPRPGRVKRIIDVADPHPRIYECSGSSEGIAVRRAELYDLLR